MLDFLADIAFEAIKEPLARMLAAALRSTCSTALRAPAGTARCNWHHPDATEQARR